MVYLRKVAADDAADLWKSDAPEKDIGLGDVTPDNMPAIQDKLSNMQHYYDKANEHMLEAFRHIRKAATYMSGNKIDGHDYENIIKLAFRDFNEARAEYFKKHRRDAWMAVFNQMEFRKWLDKVQTDAFVRDIERNGNIPFTKDNIRGTLENVFLQRRKLFEKSCANVFDELRKYHADNVHHTLTIVANLAAWRKVGSNSSSSAATWRKCPHSSTSRRNAHCSPSATFSTACHYPATFAQARCTEFPSLQWKTWVRLAFVVAGSDWRSLGHDASSRRHRADLHAQQYGYMGQADRRRSLRPAADGSGMNDFPIAIIQQRIREEVSPMKL